MKLHIKRAQKKSGMIAKNVIFTLDARTEYTEEEAFAIREYNMGGEVIYNSEKSRKHLENSATGGLFKAMTSLAMASLSLNITIESLSRGVHVECKSLDEVIAAEEAVRNACENLKHYLLIAQSFDGREEVFEY